MSRVLSAVAWPYANGPRHIGHVAGFGVPSDVFSRYMRMAGHDVLMVSGSDEHGTPILIAADEEGVTPQELADKNHRLIVEDFVALGLAYDLYTRTTTRNHEAVVQELFTGVYENGYFLEQTTFGAISPSTGRTLPDRYIEGTCPICGYEGARGDQCDNCGNQLDPQDLKNPRSRINGETPEFVETQHFFLDLPALAEALGAWLDEREATGLWRPNVIRFSKNILEEIRPRAMTRDIDWGITVPLDGWRDNPTKKLYVWFDAVIGYLSASIEWARRTGDAGARGASGGTTRRRCPTTSWARTTSPSTARSGRPSCWPTTARATRAAAPRQYGELNLPTEVVSSEFLTMEGKKFSSSKKVVIYVRDLLSRYQPDAFRYFVAAAGPENQDTDFTWAEFVRRTNDELVAGWGNLVNRTATLIHKNFGEIPAAGELTEADRGALAAAEAAFAHGRRPDRPQPDATGDRRGDAGGRPTSTSTSPTTSRGSSRGRRARAARHDPARRRAVRRRPQPGAVAVPAVLGQRGRPRARWARARSRRCRGSRRPTTSTAVRRTRSSRATTPRAPSGAATGSSRARRSASRRRSSPSSTRRSSTRSSRGSRPMSPANSCPPSLNRHDRSRSCSRRW